MESFPNQEYVLQLIEEAVDRAAQLGRPYESDLKADFVQAQATLASTTDEKSQLALVLSAARRFVNWAEKKTIGLIIGDAPITGQQMSHLVRIRMICAELINMLTRMLERARRSVAPSQLSGQTSAR